MLWEKGLVSDKTVPWEERGEAMGCCHRTVGDERSVRASWGGCGWNKRQQEARGSEAQAGRAQAPDGLETGGA